MFSLEGLRVPTEFTQSVWVAELLDQFINLPNDGLLKRWREASKMVIVHPGVMSTQNRVVGQFDVEAALRRHLAR
jgi:Mg-chelatase subunit ChlI